MASQTPVDDAVKFLEEKNICACLHPDCSCATEVAKPGNVCRPCYESEGCYQWLNFSIEQVG